MLGELIADLQSRGVRVNEEILQRSGGAGPADAGSLLIQGAPVNVPVKSPYVAASPYCLEKVEGRLFLSKDGLPFLPVGLVARPRFYGLSTEEGVPFHRIALLHGSNCLATSVLQTCLYWNSQSRCRFCGIGLSLEGGKTVSVKTPTQLAEVSLAARDLDEVSHVVLTTGTGNPPGREISLLAEAAAAVRRRTGLPIHAQFLPPAGPDALHHLKEAGVDTVGIHVESFDREVLSREAPVKAAMGTHRYEQAWKAAVEIFGPNQVSSFLIVGMGETPSSVIMGSETLADLGVYPFVVPLRPIPGSHLAGSLPPSPDLMKALYEETAKILSRKGLSAAQSLAGCVRCGACSALPAFEKGASGLVCHPVRTKEELEQAFEARREVFVEEQGIFEGSDHDENDSKSVHLVVESAGGILGTVRVFPSGEGNGQWIGGRLAVKKSYRSSGAGELLVREAVRYVRRQGCTRFTAHIQKKNILFFERLGWKGVGLPEMYCGRFHQLMEAGLEEDKTDAVAASPSKREYRMSNKE